MESASIVLLTFVIAFFGSIVAAIAGFGFSLVAAPPLLLVYDPPQVTAMLLLVTIATRWILLADSWPATNWRTVVALLPAAYIGIALGLLLLRSVDSAYIKLLASGVVIAAASLMVAGWQPGHANSHAAAPLAGLCSGILSPTTGMDGTPIVLLFTSRQYTSDQLRSTITVFYYLLTPVTLLALVQQGFVGKADLWLAVALVPAVVAGLLIGMRLVKRVSAPRFRQGVLLLLFFNGTIVATAALLSFR